MADVKVVGGPPGAGKTHYVREHMQAGDIVVDVDALAAALSGRPWYERTEEQLNLTLDVREFLLLRLTYPSDIYTAWVITSAAGAGERGSIAEQCNARETIMLLEPARVCIERIGGDERRVATLARWGSVVQQWWTEYEPIAGETVVRTEQG